MLRAEFGPALRQSFMARRPEFIMMPSGSDYVMNCEGGRSPPYQSEPTTPCLRHSLSPLVVPPPPSPGVPRGRLNTAPLTVAGVGGSVQWGRAGGHRRVARSVA